MKPQANLTAVVAFSVIAVVIALAKMPYGYYQLLRLWLCGSSLFLISRLDRPRAANQAWLLGGLAVLYNPVMPVVLGDKDVWTAANIGTVVYFWVLVQRAIVR